MSSIKGKQVNHQKTLDKVYSSLQEWETRNFPNLVKRIERKAMESRPGCSEVNITNKIFRDIHLELSKNLLDNN
ncbi:hypothetical protein IQ243_10845 [Nostocales cyanobacterium LEGE 11386]|nr:hypothetical protein [Nostocales cyanobacterium LEGE 11386]